MPDFTGGYTSAVNDQSQRRLRDVEMQRMLQTLTFQQEEHKQQQEDRQRALAGAARGVDVLGQIDTPPGVPSDGPQTPPPGAPSLPMMPPGQQPGPANVQTAAAPAPMPPMPTPMPSGPPSIPPGMFPPGTMTGTAPNPQAALERMRAMDKAGQPGAVMAPGPNWQMSPAAPPGLGGQPPAPPPSPSPDGGIAPPPSATPREPQFINPKDFVAKAIKGGATPLEAYDAWRAMEPAIEENNKAYVQQFGVQAKIAKQVTDYQNRLLREARERDLEDARQRRGDQADRRLDYLEGGGSRGARSGGAGGAPSGLTQEGIDAAAHQYLRDGKMPSLGFDAASKRAILDRAGQIDKERGGDPADLPGERADFHANSLALNAITKDLTSIKPFAEMLDKNAGILKDLATKVSKTDVSYANKTLNWLGKNVTGDADVAEYLAQMRFVQTEASRVLNNPRLVGQLTDTARHEMEGVVDGTLSLDQTNRVIDRILQDSRNRVGAMEKQRDALAKSLRGGSATSVPTTGNGPKTGAVEDGYRFKGGDPAKRENWEKV